MTSNCMSYPSYPSKQLSKYINVVFTNNNIDMETLTFTDGKLLIIIPLQLKANCHMSNIIIVKINLH